MLAGWFEFYAFAMELNVWTSTEPTKASWDTETERWTVELRRSDGSTRTLQPRHFVLATGMSGLPNVPEFEGADDFHGPVVPASWYKVDDDVEGKRAVVVGAGNSGHDIAQELHALGADVTMVQRSSTCVVSVEPSAAALFKPYHEGGPPDRGRRSRRRVDPLPDVGGLSDRCHKQFAEWDRELLDSLEKVGFQLDIGEDGSGFYPKYLRTGGGYYLNVGCSDLIASGEIALKPGAGVERLTKDTVVLSDGAELPADIVVLATGFKNMQELFRVLVGDEVAEKGGACMGVA
jgi:cation diffusion facilitator CzcD-associated flavoprotein CzcO